jgi:hypothetical protein
MKQAILCLMAVGLCSAQTTVNGGRDYKGTLKTSGTISSVDFSAAGSTAPVKTGTLAARPAACTQGQLYFATDAASGQNLSACTTTGNPGTWTQISGSGRRRELLVANDSGSLEPNKTMKRLLTFLFFAGVLSAQYAAVPGTQYPALESILNAKPAMTRAAGVPSGNCTQALDLYLNTTNGDLYVCSATNTWLKVTGAGGGAPSAHAATHQNGGGDEVATATPGANAIPKAGAGGKLAMGFLASGTPDGTRFVRDDGTLAVPPGGGSGITTMTTGAADPVASCTAPGTSNLALYTQTTTQDIWACVATDTWKKVLSTTNTGTFVATGATGTAPSNPASGADTCWYDITADTQLCKNSAGNVYATVKTAASRTANQFVTHVGATGIPATAAIASSDLPAANRSVTIAGYEVGAEDAAAALTTTNLTNHAIKVNDAYAKTLTEASCISDVGDQTVTVKIAATTMFTIHCVAPGTYSIGTTDGTTGYIIAASMGSTAVGAHTQLDLSGTANATTKNVKLYFYGTVN